MSKENDHEEDESAATSDLVEEVEEESPVVQDEPEKSQGDKLQKLIDT